MLNKLCWTTTGFQSPTVHNKLSHIIPSIQNEEKLLLFNLPESVKRILVAFYRSSPTMHFIIWCGLACVCVCVCVPSVQHTSKSRPLDRSQETALPPPPGIIRGSDPLINTNKHSPLPSPAPPYIYPSTSPSCSPAPGLAAYCGEQSGGRF